MPAEGAVVGVFMGVTPHAAGDGMADFEVTSMSRPISRSEPEC